MQVLGYYDVLDASVAQLVEQLPFKEMVAGSIPAGRTMHPAKIKEACQALRKKGYTLNEIVQKTGLPKTTVYDFISGVLISSELHEAIQRKKSEGVIARNKARKGKCWPGRELIFPQNWDERLVFVVAHFMFDGRIAYRGCEYYNRSNALVENVIQETKTLFGIEPRKYLRKNGVIQLGYIHVELGRFMLAKAKELKEYILTAPKNEKVVFLKAFFDDEGCVNIYKNNRKVRGYQKDPEILHLIEGLLSEFNIKTRVSEKFKEIIITRKENIKQFAEVINFSKGIFINPDRKNSVWGKTMEKREILSKVIASYQN